MVEIQIMKREEKKLELKEPTINQTNENCQVFNGPISGCVFAMPGATVNQSPVQKVNSAKLAPPQQSIINNQERNEEQFHFVHPEVGEEEAWQIHNAVKRLVKHQKVLDICIYLNDLKTKGKVLLPQSPSIAYKELLRMGMPSGEGYSEKYFSGCYLK